MSAGLPVVASDIPAHREVVRVGRTGFLASDPAAMARSVATLAKDEGLRREMGVGARTFVRDHLTSEACTQAFLDLYRSVVERQQDRKSTRLNSSHLVISYAVFCLKKKKS